MLQVSRNAGPHPMTNVSNRKWLTSWKLAVPSGCCVLEEWEYTPESGRWLCFPGQNGRHFADDIFKRIFLNENVRISIQFSLKFVPTGPIDNKSAYWFRIVACSVPSHYLNQCCPSSLTHICGTRGRWVNTVKELVLLQMCSWSILLKLW